jgi:hypothetical protein
LLFWLDAAGAAACGAATCAVSAVAALLAATALLRLDCCLLATAEVTGCCSLCCFCPLPAKTAQHKAGMASPERTNSGVMMQERRSNCLQHKVSCSHFDKCCSYGSTTAQAAAS